MGCTIDGQHPHDIIEKIAELIRHGINAANDDLRNENEEKLMQEVGFAIFI